MANLVNFKKGLLQNLPATKTEGTWYVCTDERSLYLDVDASTRIRIGDFQEFATLAELQANANPSTTALYYVADINCLAKWNGSSYTQINTDTGATSFEVTGDGNAVTAVSYDAQTRKLTLTKGATYMTAADVDGKVATAVGTLGNDKDGNAYANVKAYVDAKTAGIATDAALGDLQAVVSGHTDAIATLTGEESTTGSMKAIAKAYADGKDKAIEDAAQAAADAKAAADSKIDLAGVQALNYATKAEAEGYANAKDEAISSAQAKANEAYDLASGKATMEQVNAAISGAGHAVKSEVEQTIAGLDAAYKAADSALETKLQGAIDGKVAQDVYDAKMTALNQKDAALVAEDERLAGLIGGIDTAYKTADSLLDARLVEVETFFKTAEEETLNDALDTLVEIQKYITDEGAAADQMVLDIAANKSAIDALDVEVGNAATKDDEGNDVAATGLYKVIADGLAAEKSRAEGIEAGLTAADATNLQAAKDYADGEIAKLNINEYAKSATLDAHTGNKDIHVTTDDKAKWNAAQTNAEKTAADALAAVKSELENADAAINEKFGAEYSKEATVASAIDDAKQAGTDAMAALTAHKGVYDAKVAALEAEDADIRADFAAADAGLKALIDANAGDIGVLKGDANTDGSVAKAIAGANTYADGVAGAAEAAAKAYVEGLLAWGTF